jgi:hypothetical protein
VKGAGDEQRGERGAGQHGRADRERRGAPPLVPPGRVFLQHGGDAGGRRHA